MVEFVVSKTIVDSMGYAFMAAGLLLLSVGSIVAAYYIYSIPYLRAISVLLVVVGMLMFCALLEFIGVITITIV
ncbi:MAG: hypothetical protein PHC39_04710 [Proteiniphilum sp.]|nr:hypothetical protein [Proteiniphilum sp.]